MHQLLNLFSQQRKENRFMAGFRNLSLNVVVKQGIFDIISDYISHCCSEMEKDLRDKGLMIKNDENKMRDYLLEHFLNDNDLRRQMHMEMFLFFPEAPENYVNLEKYKGRVDIKIIHNLETFVDNKAVYFIECKRIDGKSKLNKEYVKNGVSRFVVFPPLYNSYYNKNFMLGFLVEKIDNDANVKKIERIQDATEEIQNVNGIIKIKNKQFNCDYLMGNKHIQLRHIFIDFSNIIE